MTVAEPVRQCTFCVEARERESAMGSLWIPCVGCRARSVAMSIQADNLRRMHDDPDVGETVRADYDALLQRTFTAAELSEARRLIREWSRLHVARMAARLRASRVVGQEQEHGEEQPHAG